MFDNIESHSSSKARGNLTHNWRTNQVIYRADHFGESFIASDYYSQNDIRLGGSSISSYSYSSRVSSSSYSATTEEDPLIHILWITTEANDVHNQGHFPS